MKISDEQVMQLIRIIELLCHPNYRDKVNVRYVYKILDEIKELKK